MSKRFRYSLIMLGFVVFAVLAPAIVIYVRGLSYDFSTHRFVKTGILSIKTDPQSVAVYLNQKLARTSGGDVRFLPPGEYNLRLQRAGYFDWVKRLTIAPGSVAWVYPAYTKVYLLKSNPKQNTVSDNVLDFYQNGDTLAYLTSNNLIISSLSNPAVSQNYTLPAPVNTIAAAGDGNNFVLSGGDTSTPVILLFQNQTKTFTTMSADFMQMPQLQFFGSTLYALDSGTLYSFDASLRPQKILADVKTFTVDAGTLYYISQNGTSTTFSLSQNIGGTSQLIMTDLPAVSSAKIIVDSGKHVFLLANGSLYRVSTKNLVPLADNVSAYALDESGTQLAYIAGGEVHQYNGATNSDTLLTRSVSPLANIVLSTDYNYVFFTDASGLTALDLNTDSPRNEYTLYSGQIKKMILDSGASTVLLLDGTTLQSLTIR